MLDSTRNADSDIQIRRHALTCLTNLAIVRNIASINRRPRSTYGRAQFVRNRIKQLEIATRPHATPTRDDHAGPKQLRALGGAGRSARQSDTRIRCTCINLLYVSRAGGITFLCRKKCRRPYGQHANRIITTHSNNDISRIDRPYEGCLIFNRHHIGYLTDIQQRSDPRCHSTTKCGSAADDVCAAVLANQSGCEPRHVFWHMQYRSASPRHQHSRHASQRGQLDSSTLRLFVGHNRHDIAQLRGRRDHGQCGRSRYASKMLRQQKNLPHPSPPKQRSDTLTRRGFRSRAPRALAVPVVHAQKKPFFRYAAALAPSTPEHPYAW